MDHLPAEIWSYLLMRSITDPGQVAIGATEILTVQGRVNTKQPLSQDLKDISLMASKFLCGYWSFCVRFPSPVCSPSALGSGIHSKTEYSSLNITYVSSHLALQLGSRYFKWSYQLENIPIPILGSEFLHHYHLLVHVSQTIQPWNLFLLFYLAHPTAALDSSSLCL